MLKMEEVSNKINADNRKGLKDARKVSRFLEPLIVSL